MRRVRWGLLSTASINRALILAIRASRRGDLVAVASRQRERAIEYAAKWEIPLAFGSYQEMLDSGAVDAVYISLPNDMHAQWSIQAMQAGRHVLCEKPFAISLEQFDAMVAAKQQTGRVLAEAFMYRHHPQTKIAGQWAHSGNLGQITLVRGTFDFNMAEDERGPHNFNLRLAPEQGGGCLWDVGVYPLSFAQFILGGPPRWVCGSRRIGDTGVDEVFAGQMLYEPRKSTPPDHSALSMAQISSSFRSPLHTFVEIVGTEGRLHLNRPFIDLDKNRRLLFYPSRGDPQEILVPEQELYSGEVEDMHAAILDQKPNYVQLEETRDHIQTVLALQQSAKHRQPVVMDFLKTRPT